MIVTEYAFGAALESLQSEAVYIVDTETTGLSPWQGDRLFSVIVGRGSNDDVFYFNFNPTEDFSPEEILPKEYYLKQLCSVIFSDPLKMVVMHNAKFDLGMFYQEGMECLSRVWDTEVMARVEYNDHMRYRLEDCGKRIGIEKDDAVELYIKEHKLYKKVATPGVKKRATHKYYDRVPKNIIVPYGIQDVRVTKALFKHQWNLLSEEAVVANEMEFTKVLFDIQKVGERVDKKYCAEAFAHEHECYMEAQRQFEVLTNESFVDSGKNLARIFQAQKIELPKTEKGNPQVSEKVLESLDHPLAKLVLLHREHYKKAHTYYQNLLLLSDETGGVHPDFKQAGARTGRLSCKTPNLQNVPKEEAQDAPFKVRKAFVPRDGYFFVELDYKAMEFRMMLDYAGQTDLIRAIQGGLDPHQATADLVSIERKPAKVLNFGLLYGMGIDKLAGTLGISRDEAKRFRDRYFGALPAVKGFLRGASRAAELRGYVRNWAGRKYYFSNPEFAYKAANALIQGGCAEIVKFAMVMLRDYLQKKKSRMVLQVHDSILFEIAWEEFHIVEDLANLMAKAFPHKMLAMECDIKWSASSWGDLEDWSTFEKRRNSFQGKDGQVSSQPPQYMVRENPTTLH